MSTTNEPPLILVVEDEPDVRSALVELLEAEGYGVAEARHGAAAWRLLQQGVRPALMTLDLMMPVLDGWTLLTLVRTDRQLRELPVLVLSAGTSTVVPGATAVLPKPFAPRALLELVRSQLAPLQARGTRRAG